jgi:hypothetical protein
MTLRWISSVLSMARIIRGEANSFAIPASMSARPPASAVFGEA